MKEQGRRIENEERKTGESKRSRKEGEGENEGKRSKQERGEEKERKWRGGRERREKRDWKKEGNGEGREGKAVGLFSPKKLGFEKVLKKSNIVQVHFERPLVFP